MSVFARQLPGVSSLLTGLTSYWKMDEPSGTRADSQGSNNLTANGGPGNAPAKINSGVSFVAASTQYLSVASNAGLQIGNNDREMACWLKLTDKSATYAIIGKNNGTSIVGSEFLFYYNSGSDRFEVAAYQGAGTVVTAVANNFGSPTAGVFYYISAFHDSVNDLVGIEVNGGTANTVALAGGCNATATAFTIGATAFPSSPMNGVMDAVGWWSRVLTMEERLNLYNGGAGTPYPFIGMP